MRFPMLSAAAAALSLLAQSVPAQEVVPEPVPVRDAPARFGIGVTLNPAALIFADVDEVLFLPVGLGNIRFPVHLGSNVRLEPELGYFSTHADFQDMSFSSSNDLTILRYGIGAFYVLRPEESVRFTIGPRIGFLRTSEESRFSSPPNPPSENKTKRTDNYIGLALGGEYWFSTHFSLGAEIQLSRVGIGDTEVEPPPQPPPTSESSARITTTNALVIIRYLF